MNRAFAACAVALLPVLSGCAEPSSAPAAAQLMPVPSARSACLTLGAPNQPNNEPRAINDRGEIVGNDGTGSYLIRPPYRQRDEMRENYPGAASTAFYAISRDGTIAGAYTDSEGTTHGLIRGGTSERDALWQSFEYAGARRLTVLTGINASGELAGYFRSGKSIRGFLCR